MQKKILIRYGALMLAVYACWVALYYLTAWIGSIRGPAFDAALPLDASIPFWPGLMPVYLLAYIVTLGLFFISLKPDFLNRAYATFIVTNAVAFLFFALFPVLGPPREGLLTGVGTSTDGLLALMHALDSRYNALPSLHVANPWLVALLCTREKGLSGMTVFFWLLALAISAATLFVRQHYFLDVLSGAFLAVICFAIMKQPRPAK